MYIKRENAIRTLDEYAQALYSENYSDMGRIADTCSVLLEDVKEEYVVPIEQYHKLNFKCTVLKALLNGEWVKCNDVQEALNITFDQGMKMFQFGVEGTWPPTEHNVSFRISEQTISQTKTKDFERDFEIQEKLHRNDFVTNNLDLLIEQQGGII